MEGNNSNYLDTAWLEYESDCEREELAEEIYTIVYGDFDNLDHFKACKTCEIAEWLQTDSFSQLIKEQDFTTKRFALEWLNKLEREAQK